MDDNCSNNNSNNSNNSRSTPFRLPEYSSSHPEVWLFKCESHLLLAGIRDSHLKYHHLVSVLPMDVAEAIVGVIRNPDRVEPFEVLKSALLQKFDRDRENIDNSKVMEKDINTSNSNNSSNHSNSNNSSNHSNSNNSSNHSNSNNSSNHSNSNNNHKKNIRISDVWHIKKEEEGTQKIVGEKEVQIIKKGGTTNKQSSPSGRVNLAEKQQQQEKKELSCPQCNRFFVDVRHLNRHLATVHQEEKEPKRGILLITNNSTTTTNSNTSNSTNNNSNNSNTNNSTTTTNNNSNTSNNSNSNDRTNRIRVKQQQQVKCPDCSKTFGSSRCFGRHFAAVHQGKRPHTCKQCGKSFSQSGGLSRHVDSVHRGIKLWGCQKCERAFGEKKNLERHVAAVHPEG